MLLVWIAQLQEDVLYVHAKTYPQWDLIIIRYLTKGDSFLELDTDCHGDLLKVDAFLNDDFGQIEFAFLVKTRWFEEKLDA